MKRSFRAIVTLAAAICLLCVAALADGAGLSNLDNTKGAITAVQTADGTAVTADENGFYANAEKFTVAYSQNITSGSEYALFVIKGDEAPGDLNIFYIDQQTAGESGVSFTAFPKEMESGAYNVYLTGSGAPGITQALATFDYTAPSAGGLAIGAEWVGQVNDTTHRVYVNVPGAAQVQIAVWADTECAADNDAAKQWIILDNDGTNDFIGDFTYAAHSNISGLYHATVYASPNGVDSWQNLKTYDFDVTVPSAGGLAIGAEWIGPVNETTHQVYVNVPGAAQVQIAVWADTECAADNDAAKQWLILNNDGSNDFIGNFAYAAHSNISGLYHATVYASPNGVDSWQNLKTYDFTVTAPAAGLTIGGEWIGQVSDTTHRVYVYVAGATQVQIAVWADTECAADNDPAKQWIILDNDGTNDFIGDFTYAAHSNISGTYHAAIYATPDGGATWQNLKTYDFTVAVPSSAPAPQVLAEWHGPVSETTYRLYMAIANVQQVQFHVYYPEEFSNTDPKQWIVLNNDGTNDFIGDFSLADHNNMGGQYYADVFVMDTKGEISYLTTLAFTVEAPSSAPAPQVLAEWHGPISETTYRLYMAIANVQQVQFHVYYPEEFSNTDPKQWLVLNNDGTNDFFGDFSLADHNNTHGQYYADVFVVDTKGAISYLTTLAFTV